MKIVAGNYPPTEGRISIEGRGVSFSEPVDAREAGIEIVYRDLALCDNLTAAANVAVQGMMDILAANPDLTAFLSTGAFTQWFDNAYRQAAEPYKAKMDAGELTIVVADTLPMQLEQTRDGLGNGFVGQRPFEMDCKAMYILKDIVEGKSVDDPIYTGLDVCDNDNVDTCVN